MPTFIRPAGHSAGRVWPHDCQCMFASVLVLWYYRAVGAAAVPLVSMLDGVDGGLHHVESPKNDKNRGTTAAVF